MSSDSSTESIDDIYALMDQQGKATPAASTGTFLGTLFVGVPVWLTVVLPLSIVTQVTKAVLVKPFVSPPEPNDTGTKVNAADIIPRPERKYDVVVLGATGFTGTLVAEHIAKTYGVGKSVKWAIAGRSKSKLEKVKKDLSDRLGTAVDVDTIIVDTSVVADLPGLVKDTRAVISTAGPFQKYGSNVVEFCAKYGTHYVDITGECDWVKTMMFQWEDTAKETGAKLVSLCGFDSVPWDLSVMKLQQALPDGEELISAECLNESIGDLSGGTAETMMLSTTTSAVRSPKSDFDMFLMLPNGSKSPLNFNFRFPLLVHKSTPMNGRLASTYSSFNLMAAVNSKVVMHSLALGQRSNNVTYREYMTNPDFKTAFCSQFLQFFFITALLNPITGFVLKKVLPKPGEGPSRKAMETRNFLTVSSQGIGSKGTKVQSVMYFPRDAGYLDTARMVAESGLTLAMDSAKLSPNGGFFTPATGMGDALLDRLIRTGTHFSMSVSKP